MTSSSVQHRREVLQGERFEFGANWSRFLSVLNDDRIAMAERSLTQMLKTARLDGKRFIDVGSGSGLFSLVARRLGATVYSFDYDPQSVACTAELRRRYFTDDKSWIVEQGSVLDREYLQRLGTFDVVYSWGVLHHTGQMWPALDNVKSLVGKGGDLFIAIYNDLQEVTNGWANVKKRYNALPRPLATLYALTVIAGQESRPMLGHLVRGNFSAWTKSWTDYAKQSTRGMSKWHDWIDWIGGYPYERASVEQIVDHFAKDGFHLTNLVDRSSGYGCNEFVFHRVGEPGELIETAIPGGTSLVRRYGRRLIGPFQGTDEGYTAPLPAAFDEFAQALLFTDGLLVGPARYLAGRVVIPQMDRTETDIAKATHFLVPGQLRRPAGPFPRAKGHMWIWNAPDLSPLADDKTSAQSPVYVLESGHQLVLPHSIHADIVKTGRGRFSHWGVSVAFSTSDNSNPNTNGREYALLIAHPRSEY
jgi:2-polyprenyl-6-hydroxyphenyl methylase/3-demethylubiquinone-9 3-methyltransferase